MRACSRGHGQTDQLVAVVRYAACPLCLAEQADELETLRKRVAELEEQLAWAERMLTDNYDIALKLAAKCQAAGIPVGDVLDRKVVRATLPEPVEMPEKDFRDEAYVADETEDLF